MKRETVQSDKAALKKQYHTVLQIMMKTFDTGQRSRVNTNETHDSATVSEGQQLLSQFRAFGQHCLQRDSEFSQLQREHQNLSKKYREKIKENKRMHKDFQEQSELLEKRQKQVYRLSMRKIKKTQTDQKTDQKSYQKCSSCKLLQQHQQIKKQEKSIQSEESFQRMEETIRRLQRQKQQLKVQLEQSRSLYRDKTLENESIKILLQKIVEDRKINGFDDDTDNQQTEREQQMQDFEQSSENSSDVQSYVSQVLENQSKQLVTKIVKRHSLDESQNQQKIIQNSASTGNSQKTESLETDREIDKGQQIKKSQKQEIEKLNLLWKACFRARNFIERYLSKQ